MSTCARGATVLGAVKGGVLAMLAPKRALRVAPVPAFGRP